MLIAAAVAVNSADAINCAVGDHLHGAKIQAQQDQSCVIYEKKCVKTDGAMGCGRQYDVQRGFKVVAAILSDQQCQALQSADSSNNDISNVLCCKTEMCNDPKMRGYSPVTPVAGTIGNGAVSPSPSPTKTPTPTAAPAKSSADSKQFGSAAIAGGALAGILLTLL